MSQTISPIQGAPGVKIEEALPYQHQWLLLSGQSLIDQNNCPALAQLEVAVRWGQLQLRAPGMMRLDIVLDVIEDDESVIEQHVVAGQALRLIDEGELAGAWFSNFLQQPVRLYKRL